MANCTAHQTHFDITYFDTVLKLYKLNNLFGAAFNLDPRINHLAHLIRQGNASAALEELEDLRQSISEAFRFAEVGNNEWLIKIHEKNIEILEHRRELAEAARIAAIFNGKPATAAQMDEYLTWADEFLAACASLDLGVGM